MMKKDEGITLVALTVTIVVMIILIGITLSTDYNGVDDVKDNQMKTRNRPSI